MQLQYEMSISEARMLIDILDTEEWDNFTAALNEAQGEVHSGTEKSSTLTITIKDAA